VTAPDEVDRLYRLWFGRAVGAVGRRFRDLDLAEEAVQDAFTTAIVRWRRDGVPSDPGGWIIRTASNRAVDLIRRRRVGADRERDAAFLSLLTRPDPTVTPDSAIRDERLRVLFTCCHPALADDLRLPLTLRLVCGLTVPEIARGLVLAEPAVAQRLVRGKRRVREAGIALEVPPDHALPDRLPAVLHAIYLLYTEGHTATRAEAAVRRDLCDEAIRLARLVVHLMPDEPEAKGLLALLLVTDARTSARHDADGRLIPLEEHDRSRYDQALLEEGDRLVQEALLAGGRRYAVEAAIAALHTGALTFEETDWLQIVGLYDVLAATAPSPVVDLNRAVAVSMADGPEAALPLLEAIAADGRLDRFAPLHAALADTLRRLGRDAEARGEYCRAAELTENPAERAYLSAKAAEA
jgi:RNA polymerase sigma-70 factor (ECF subfamily)